jgi:hypothetical protein
MIQNKDITIESIESKQASTGNWKYTIKDTEGNKYSFFRTIKGTDGDVYQSFTGMNPQKGDIVHIGYTEDDDSFTNAQGKVVNYKKRNIVGLREATGQTPPPSVPKAETPHYEAPQYSESREDFGKRLALHGFVNARLVNNSVEEVTKELSDLLKLEDAINEALTGKLAEISVDDIPF